MKKSSIVFGIIFLIAGVWGFLSAPILGIFAADTVSSIIHIIAGIVLLAMASKPGAVGAMKTIGVIYVIFAILGFFSVSLFITNSGANWLYLILGVILVALGWSKDSSSSSAPQM